MKLFIGLMSGTSMDGIDAALVDVEKNHCIDGLTMPYRDKTLQLLKKSLQSDKQSFKTISQLNSLIGQDFALAAQELISKNRQYANDIIAIGSHGQTVCHDSFAEIPYTLQLGCAHTIAELTGITTVGDFRTRDIIVKGQGAPFAPLYHQALFQQANLPLALINIGGIANISYLQDKNTVSGYDIGPGNCLMDAWVNLHQQQSYDACGQWASQGAVIYPLLDKMLTDPFFKRPCPKSIGKEYFSLSWLMQFMDQSFKPVDIQATLLQLTVITIAESIGQLPQKPAQLLVCGGGVHNHQLMKLLAQELPQQTIKSTAELNFNPDYIEAMMFAWLAEKTISNTPVDLKWITGANKKAILGVIYPKGIDKGI